MRHANLAAVAAALLILAAPLAAAAAPADPARAQDRAEIAELMWNYVRAIDTWNGPAYAAVFTPDGAFGQVKGREALAKMVTDLQQQSAARRPAGSAPVVLHHVMTNEHIEFLGPDRARIHYYWQTVSRGGPGGTAPSLLAQGRGVDELSRVDGRWLIQHRDVAPKD